MTGPLITIARNPSTHLGFAFLAMGGWAVFANRGHPFPQPLVAGFIQGLMSAGITRGLQKLIEALTARLTGRWAVSIPPLAAFAMSFGLLMTVHRLSETPEPLATVSLPLSVSTIYAVIYTRAFVNARSLAKGQIHGRT